MPATKLPRAAPGKPVVLDAAVWNALAAEVERLGRLTVSPPLYKDRDNPAGINLSVAGGPGTPAERFKVSNPAPSGGPANVVLAKKWDGTTLDPTEVPVRTHTTLASGAELIAVRPAGGVLSNSGTAVEYPSGTAVVWEQVQPSGLPAPTAMYQVYTPIDSTLVPTWTTPRFS